MTVVEGIVSKRKGSPYQSSRSHDRLNSDAPTVKREAEQEPTELHRKRLSRGLSPHAYRGTRMGREFNIDRNGFAHEVPNLGILGASVMGASGSHNPTLTTEALAWRTAEHLGRNWERLRGDAARSVPTGHTVRWLLHAHVSHSRPSFRRSGTAKQIDAEGSSSCPKCDGVRSRRRGARLLRHRAQTAPHRRPSMAVVVAAAPDHQ
jgi:GMC oxidoreductase